MKFGIGMAEEGGSSRARAAGWVRRREAPPAGGRSLPPGGRSSPQPHGKLPKLSRLMLPWLIILKASHTQQQQKKTLPTAFDVGSDGVREEER